jgi:prepilin-type N-terminal cleavage/methylation domain-containing protein/prepilin-type processing-associated H-X9-DG protein
MRRKGFTLIELLVVIAIIALLVSILMPGLSRARELAKRASCATNQNNIGKGLAMYTSAYGDQYPWVVSNNSWSAYTGQSRSTAPASGTNYNTTTLLFMLVRDNQSPAIFVCPSTSDKPDPNTKGNVGSTTGVYLWDFSPYTNNTQYECVSYSYQAALNTGTSGTPSYASGVNISSDSALVIMAEKTPEYWGSTVTPAKGTNFNWTTPGSADPKTGMSDNHTYGEYTNVLYADNHVGNGQRADLGIANDNIYTTASGSAETAQQGAVTPLSDHDSAKDSFLKGPIKNTNP